MIAMTALAMGFHGFTPLRTETLLTPLPFASIIAVLDLGQRRQELSEQVEAGGARGSKAQIEARESFAPKPPISPNVRTAWKIHS
jgi:hypothetical protein